MKRVKGFSLVELMISLALGLVISGAIIQVLVSSSVTNKLNQAVAQVQESGRYITSRLSSEFYEIGRYDTIVASIDNSVDTVAEAGFIENKPSDEDFFLTSYDKVANKENLIEIKADKTDLVQ